MNKVIILNLIFIFFSINILIAESYVCNTECKNLKKANYIGIKPVKEYLKRKGSIVIIPNEKTAKKKGYAVFNSCNNKTSLRKKITKKCSPVFGVIQDKKYFCISELKAFSSEKKAVANKFSVYTSCGSTTPTPTVTSTPSNETPTPTKTPSVTPLPLVLTITSEAGEKFTNLDSMSIANLSNGRYRSYTSASASSISNPDTLRLSDSDDGETFGAKIPITGVTPLADETFTNASSVLTNSGETVLIYERVKHVSSAGVDIHNLMRAVSSDGIQFAQSPQFVVIPGGSLISNYFHPSLMRLQDGRLRMYFTSSQSNKMLTSSDDGMTWDEATDVVILGRNDSYAPYPTEPSVVTHSSGKFLMFFTSSFGANPTGNSIFIAQSSDGVVFHVFDQPVLQSSGEISYVKPAAIVLPDGSIRVYYVQRTGSLNNAIRIIKSIKLSGSL